MIEHRLVDRARKHSQSGRQRWRATESTRMMGGVARRIAVKRSRNSFSLASTPGIDIHGPVPLAHSDMRCTARDGEFSLAGDRFHANR